MSYTNGAWTELERAAGIPALAEFGHGSVLYERDDDNDPHDDSPRQLILSLTLAKNLLASKMGQRVCDLTSNRAIRSRICVALARMSKDEIFGRYSARERLPGDFLYAAERSSGLSIILKDYISRTCTESHWYKSKYRADELISRLHKNVDLLTAYERVAQIQSFVHTETESALGTGAHHRLPRARTRWLLSASRLHLSWRDMTENSETYWNELWDKEVAAASEEMRSPAQGYIPINRKRIELWRVPHLKPLTEFSKRRFRARFEAISKVPVDLPVADFRVEALRSVLNYGSRYNPSLVRDVLEDPGPRKILGLDYWDHC